MPGSYPFNFSGEVVFRHELPGDRSSLARPSGWVKSPAAATERFGGASDCARARVAKRAAIMVGRYTHDHQFTRARLVVR
jgi:hypothetical protein